MSEEQQQIRRVYGNILAGIGDEQEFHSNLGHFGNAMLRGHSYLQRYRLIQRLLGLVLIDHFGQDKPEFSVIPLLKVAFKFVAEQWINKNELSDRKLDV